MRIAERRCDRLPPDFVKGGSHYNSESYSDAPAEDAGEAKRSILRLNFLCAHLRSGLKKNTDQASKSMTLLELAMSGVR
jgi:hypothetical protein